MKGSGRVIQVYTDGLKKKNSGFLFAEEYFDFSASRNDVEIVNGAVDNVNKSKLRSDFYNYGYHAMWRKALKKSVGDNSVNILEIAPYDEDVIPQVMDEIFNEDSQYVSFNRGKQLTQELNRKTSGMEISVLVMEEDEKLIPNYFGPGYFNVVVFRHSIDNVIQAILRHKGGIDSNESGWTEMLPYRVSIIQRALQEYSLEYFVKKDLLGLVSDCMNTLDQNGIMIFNHRLFRLGLDWEYPCELYQDLLFIIRKCISEIGLKLEEIDFEGFDKQRWMFLRKSKGAVLVNTEEIQC